jgi:hypothetical protein
MDTLGFWRIVATSLLAYAIVRHGHFELAPRYRRAIGFSLVTLLGVASAFGIEQAAEHASGSAGMALLLTELYIAGVLGVLAYRFRRRLSEALTTPPRGAAGVAREPAPGERIDGYVIERPLGAGSSGRAFLARDDLLRRSVVLKLLAPQDTATFLEEARFLAAMDHPRLVRIHGAGSWLGSPYLVLAHAPGGSLADRLREGPLPAGEAARLMDDALSALAYLHERGLVHGDVKPANVLLDANGRALLADLGAASRSRTTQRSLAPPAASHALGTPAYLSPEARAGALPTPGRDVFAAGVMLAEMLGPGGGGPLARVAARATRGDPADRYADAGAMREALRRAEDEERAAHAHDVAVR